MTAKLSPDDKGDKGLAMPSAAADALLAIVDATRDYLPPDGITEREFISRVIGAIDNPDINPIIRELEHGRS